MALELILATVGTGARECVRCVAVGAAGVGVGAARGIASDVASGAGMGAESGAGIDGPSGGTADSGAEIAGLVVELAILGGTRPAVADETGVLPLALDKLLMLELKILHKAN